MSSLCVTIGEVERQYYIFSVCVYRFGYSEFSAHAPL